MSRPQPEHEPERDHRHEHRAAIWTAVIVTMLWSSSWILIRIGLDDESLPPITFAGLRYGLAAAVLIASATISRTHRDEVRRLDPSAIVRLAVLGVVFYTITQGAQFIAIDSQPAATTSLVLSSTPLLVALAGSRSLGEHPASRQFVGATMVVAGAALYFAGDLGATAVGLIAAGVALGANVGGSLLGRHVNRGRSTSPIVVTAVSMTAGAAVLIVVGLIIEGAPTVTLRAGLIIGWLAVVNTAIAFTLWNSSLRRLTAIESAGINNTMLIQIAVLAWVFLGEAPGAFGVAGIVTVSIGVYLTQARTSPVQR